jgi:ABC-type uncharacterized transport system permease subunit
MEKENLNNPQEQQCNIHGVSGWAYFRKHKTPILVGFAIGTTLSILFNLIENIIVKIALIVYGG